jgi:hypothetical protein
MMGIKGSFIFPVAQPPPMVPAVQDAAGDSTRCDSFDPRHEKNLPAVEQRNNVHQENQMSLYCAPGEIESKTPDPSLFTSFAFPINLIFLSGRPAREKAAAPGLSFSVGAEHQILVSANAFAEGKPGGRLWRRLKSKS